MDFYVNNEKLDIVLENEKTIGDVLKSFETECAKNDATTIHIVLNGKNIGAEEFESIFSEPITDSTKLELTIVTKAEILASFQSQKEECEALSNELLELPVKLQSGKDKEASTLITKLADLIEKFCHTATLSALFQDIYKKLTIDGKTINEFFQDFSGILNDFEQAIASKDTVLMGDLAEYEISPRLLLIAGTIKEL
ncbi:MAG: hypothetical protein IJJ71_04470 [Treponema sp.]|uniref:hypothetical protein n=1 Tax=Treponema sp. TaxID=166 RepID=UPI0025D7339D|nr:hypothetical protein [Treponema sp.]MBQ9622144.1 hypothetical protein [Treponema sp.]MBR0099320.1 hypothetical protein [Treponema sp.]MBR0495416.1 hypothetical protein [Treponema sp.]